MTTRVKSRHVVKPAEPTWQGIFPLSELDQIGVITHGSTLYFYNRPTQDWLDSSNKKIINTLKTSLSGALVPFYPLAGRLSWIGGGRLQLECNAMGAELIEAESNKKISDFGDFSHSSQMFRDLLPHMDYGSKPIHELPLVAVQVTQFACGGLSVGIELSHVIVDGTSAFHFVREWGRLALGQPLLVAPSLDRRVLQVETKDRPREKGHGAEFMDTHSQLHSGDGQVQNSENVKQLVPTVVVMTKDHIQRLKEVANRVAHELGRPYSRFEAIAAHVWRCSTNARGLKSDQMTTIFVVVDARSRTNPLLSSSYFGNATVLVEASSGAGELLSRPLSYACSKVREAVEKVNIEYVLETIKLLKDQPSLRSLQFIEDRGSMEGSSNGEGYHNDIMITSLLNLPAQRVDFGWGKEIYAGPPIGVAGDSYTMLFPHMNNDGSMVVAAWVQPKEKFLKYMGFSVASKI